MEDLKKPRFLKERRGFSFYDQSNRKIILSNGEDLMRTPFLFRDLSRSSLALVFAVAFFSLTTPEVRAAAGDVLWNSQPPLPTGTTQLGIAAVGGKIYTVGGYVGVPSNAPYNVLAYDLVENTFQVKAPIPTPRGGLGVASVQGKIYAIGGYLIDEYGVQGESNIVQEYDPQTNTWRSRMAMLTSRSGLAIAELNGKIYVAGGASGESPNLAYHTNLEMYDPASDTWTVLPPMLIPRSEFALVASNGKLYAIGGYYSDPQGQTYQWLNTVEAYDPVSGIWSSKASLPNGLGSHGAVSLDNGHIYVFGGRTAGFVATNAVVKYDPDANSWTSAGTMGTSRFNFGIVKASGENIYLVGGNTGASQSMPVNLTERATIVYPWTIMCYIANDNDLDSTSKVILQGLREQAALNPNVHVILLLDRPTLALGASYYWLAGDPQAPFIEGENKWYKGILDTGDPVNLVNFVTRARNVFPAERYALVLSDHGMGLNGAMQDRTSPRDPDGQDSRLTLKEIWQAMNTITESGAKKIDVLYMEACLMGMVESAYQVRSFVNYYVASETKAVATTRGYVKYISSIKADTTPLELSIQFVDAYSDFVMNYAIPGTSDDFYIGYYTMSVADMSKIDRLVSAIHDFVASVKADFQVTARQLSRMILNNEFYEFQYHSIYDLYDFASKIKTAFTDTNIQAAAQGVMDAIIPYIVYSKNGNNADRAHGVAIYFAKAPSSFYNVDNIDFAEGAQWIGATMIQDTQTGPGWGPFLVEYIKITKPNGEDISTPPPLMPRELIGEYRLYLPLLQR
jgi:N-acetylneuraminic acid mutarotase